MEKYVKVLMHTVKGKSVALTARYFFWKAGFGPGATVFPLLYIIQYINKRTLEIAASTSGVNLTLFHLS